MTDARKADARRAEPEEARPPRNRRKLMIGGAVASVMILEGVLVFLVVKVFTGQEPAAVQAAQHAVAPSDSVGGEETPAAAHGEAHAGEQAASAAPAAGDVEIELACFQAPNLKSGRTYVYDVCMVARVREPNVPRFRMLKEQKANEITARLSEIIRVASPEHLKEDRLQTIRRQAMHVLAEILGEAGLVDEILITRWMVFYAE
jgi:hypothetical protein